MVRPGTVAMNDVEGGRPLGRNGPQRFSSYTADGRATLRNACEWVRAESVPYPPQHDSAHRENEVKMSRSCLLMSGTKTRAMCSVAPLDRAGATKGTLAMPTTFARRACDGIVEITLSTFRPQLSLQTR